MTSVSLSGEIGLSTHEDRMVRIWEAASGRRIASHHSSQARSRAATRSELAAVGNEQGVVSLFDSMATRALGRSSSPSRWMHRVTAPRACAAWRSDPQRWGRRRCASLRQWWLRGHAESNRRTRPALATDLLWRWGDGSRRRADGLALDTEPCHVYVARGHKAWQVDVERDAIVWEVPDMDSDTHLAALMARMGDDLTRSHGAPLLGQRIASYSPGWRLLATATPTVASHCGTSVCRELGGIRTSPRTCPPHGMALRSSRGLSTSMPVGMHGPAISWCHPKVAEAPDTYTTSAMRARASPR